MANPKDSAGRPRLVLVVSERKRPLAEDSAKGHAQGSAVQLTLFPDESGPVVIYVRPSDSNVQKIVEWLRGGYIHAVLDIRETPFLSFSDVSRENFLRIVAESNAEYINIHRLMRGVGHENVRDFFVAISQSEREDVLEILESVVKKGPVFVFSDREPDSDDIVASFEAGLKKKCFGFSASYLRDQIA